MLVEGVVIGPDGPVHGAYVELTGRTARGTQSDAEGRFSLEGLAGPGAACQLHAVWRDGGTLWRSATVEARPGDPPACLELERP